MGRSNTTSNISTPADPPQNVALGSVVKSDSVNFAFAGGIAYAFSFPTAGAFKVTTVGGQDVDYASGELVAGVMHSLQIVRLWDSGIASTMKLYY